VINKYDEASRTARLQLEQCYGQQKPSERVISILELVFVPFPKIIDPTMLM